MILAIMVSGTELCLTEYIVKHGISLNSVSVRQRTVVWRELSQGVVNEGTIYHFIYIPPHPANNKTKTHKTCYLPQNTEPNSFQSTSVRLVICCLNKFCERNVGSKRVDTCKDHFRSKTCVEKLRCTHFHSPTIEKAIFEHILFEEINASKALFDLKYN